VSVSTAPGARIVRVCKNATGAWIRLGEQAQFYAKTVAGIKDVFIHYKVELLRMFAQMSIGVGALALIGGSIVIVGFLTSQVGTLVAIQIYGSLADVGVQALTGFGSAYINVRLSVPLITAVSLSATIGASTTAALGAMRINEEIDALESISVRTIGFLCSTRLVAGVMLTFPLYCVSLLAAFTATRLGVTLAYGQTNGVYDHYFNTFLNPTDVALSFMQAVLMATAVMLIHTYYGYNAAGGPAGVGEAVGRAVRSSMVAAISINLLIALAVYGQGGGLHLSG
jgi:phospholipid/cholesterol/gamma-HCH transport system permease protein